MPDHPERLETIAEARAAYRLAEEHLYRTRLRLGQLRKQLARAQAGQPLPPADRDAAMEALQTEIAETETRLTGVGDESRQVDDWFTRLDEAEKLVDHLERSETSARHKMADLQEALAAADQEDPPDAKQVARLREEIERLEQDQANLARSTAVSAEDRDRLRGDSDQQRDRRESLRAELRRLRDSLQRARRELADLRKPELDDGDELRDQARRLEEAVKEAGVSLGERADRLGDLVGGLFGRDRHPRTALTHLDDGLPFLLLPVRIETIFVPSDRGTELWVRIYPDDIAVNTHEATLTDLEVTAGELYWTELAIAEHLRADRDTRRRTTWRHIVQQLSGPRAAWVARQTKPSDWDALTAAGATQTLIAFLQESSPGFLDDLLALAPADATRSALQQAIGTDDGDAFIKLVDEQRWGERLNAVVRQQILGFPAHDLTKTDAWTRAPRTHVLPDRFVLLLYGSPNDPPREIPGELVPDVLTLGPDPLDAEVAFQTADGALTFGAAFSWMSNFDEAVAKGMGFKVPLSGQEAAQGFARIAVLGVTVSAEPTAAAAVLEELIQNHQFGTKGFSIVPQGTPTNNTTSDGTGYSDNDAYDDLAFFTETGPPAFDPADPDPRRSQTDGRRLADALGISYTPLLTVQHADRVDVLEATAMNAALFPATLGYWLRTWMSPVVTDEAAWKTRSFFTSFVTGRGPVPAVRVGDQPYGVLVTSDFSRWTYPENSGKLGLIRLLDGEIPFLARLRALLAELVANWDGIAATLPYAGRPGTDSSEVLINLLGLHPTSVELFQRIGYSDEYLRNLDSFKDKGRYANELASLVSSMPPTARVFLQDLGVPAALGDVQQMQSMHVLWQHYTTRLDVPNLVEARPSSETAQLRANYIDWLAGASGFDAIVRQQFPGTPPTALLYLMLRTALLLQLHQGAYDWLRDRSTFDETLVMALRATTLPGVRSSTPTLSRYEVMGVMAGTVQPASVMAGTSVGDLVWHGFDTVDTEAAFVAEQRSALEVLSRATTAALERALVEHLDCCQYRLDAWETGLFAHRLAAQRRFGSDDRATGIHLGAYGWVEDVRPASKVFLEAEDLPEALRPTDRHPLLEEDDVAPVPGQPVGAKRGGFVHAPSINHASAAAVLRNAYLSHADPAKSELFSVNLSSERVRRAEFVLEGMRNGQPIEALLGYQFERGLHDRTSASAARGDIPVLELNQFILPFRQAFPFEAREVMQAGTGDPTDAMPAYNVVNGLRLNDAALNAGNGFGLSGVLGPARQPGNAQGAAILAEQDALRDTLDAVKDLLMAENAYQLVQGNFDRVAAVSLAQKEARVPPSLQVIETPRGSELTFTHRVTVHFNDLDAALPPSNPWPAVPMTPRACTEPGLNHWLGSVLTSAPGTVVCEVSADQGGADVHRVTLAELGLQPIDFVTLASAASEQTGGATELETRVVHAYRRAHGITESRMASVAFNPEPGAGELTFAQLFPLARQLRALVTEGRAATARDFLPAPCGRASSTIVDATNPHGYDVPDLRARVLRALADLSSLADALDGGTAPTVDVVLAVDPADPTADITFSGPLGQAFDQLEAARLEFTDPAVAVTFLVADAEAVATTLRRISAFGISDAFPPQADLTDAAVRADLLARAHRVARRLRRADPPDGVLDLASGLVAEAAAPLGLEDQVKLMLEAGGLLFSDTIRLLPAFTCPNDAELALADADRAQLLSHAVGLAPGATVEQVVDEWLQPLGRVRPRMRRWDLIRTLAEAQHDVTLEMRPVQVPYRVQDSWLAVDLPEHDPLDAAKPFGISRDTLSITAHGDSAFQPGQRQRAILLDEWTEEIPTAREITGISFRFNQPNAAPPQTLLLAVTPEETGSWNWDDLTGMLVDTFARAKRRAVEPAQLDKQGLVWNAFAPALVSEFSTEREADVSLDLMVMLDYSPLADFYASAVGARP
jgi:predicted  nucleic acid-binding Zn-ribbon protein